VLQKQPIEKRSLKNRLKKLSKSAVKKIRPSATLGRIIIKNSVGFKTDFLKQNF